ncbi:sulfite exporter TauE/SafE family protein [Candidatus Uhrbacteria bacterium]|nr:sulfite exporter TauE/SafE family protein [Candidatus Uhrbacteria bacterium]
MSRVVIYDVTGMTCTSCERLISGVLKEIPGVLDVEVSQKIQRAAVRLPDENADPVLADVNAKLREHGYALYPKGQRPAVCATAPTDPFVTRLKRALVAFGLVGLVALLLTPLRKAVPALSGGTSFGAMFALGLVASASTCLASTGGFLLAYSSKHPSRLKAIAIHIGRLAAFVVGGAALGAIGGSLPQGSAAWYGLLGIVLGIGFLAVGLQLLELAPRGRFALRLPRSFNRLADLVIASEKPTTPFLVGAVTFILPCGFTQTAQGLALASGSPQQGLLLLTSFALGTLPVLLGVTLFGSVATLRYRLLRLSTGAVLTFFALGQIDGGLIVLGSPVTPSTLLASFTVRTSAAAIPAANAEEQVIKMTVAADGYQPSNLQVKKGIPVRWEIDGQAVVGCVNSLVVPSYGISEQLKPGMNIVRFTPDKAGVVPFSCAMGMVRGSFTVTE